MKTLILALSLAVASIGFVPVHADAKRFGGGGSSGMQRSMPSRSPDISPPSRPTQATPTPAPSNIPAPAPRRSWMGPIAGLAAGLGIGALLSHFGMGGGFGNLITMVLLALVAFMVIRFVMRRFSSSGGPRMATPNGMPFAGNGGPPRSATGFTAAPQAAQMPLQPATPTLPAGFDAAGFERIAKMIFIRMQAANDTGDLGDLRTFTTPEMFSTVRLELQERGTATQQTDVVRVDAQVRDVVVEGDRQIVSVRFHGLIREELNGPTAGFDEVWHLVRPVDGSRDWAIAGIQQADTAAA